MKQSDRISLIIIAVSFVIAYFLTTCRHDPPHENQEDLRFKAQQDSIESAQYYLWLNRGDDTTGTFTNGCKVDTQRNAHSDYSSELEYFDEHFDDYFDDPEDGITYPDDIFDYLND